MPWTSFLGRCRYRTENYLTDGPEEHGYLVAEIGDIIRIEYEGTHGDEVGWLFGTCVLELHPERFRRFPKKHRGWIQALAIERMRPPGPIKRRAWDGFLYSVLEWQEYYGDYLGMVFWEEAEHD